MAILFDEVNDYYTIADAAELTCQNGDWAVGIWTYVTDNAGSAYQYVISNRNFGVSRSLQIYLAETSTSGSETPGAWVFSIRDDAGTNPHSPSSWTESDSAPGADSTWRLVVLQRNTSKSRFELWFCEEGQKPTLEATLSDSSFGQINGSTWNIGRRNDGNVDRYYGSAAAEFFKIDQALTADQIQSLGGGRTVLQIGLSPDVYMGMVEYAATLTDESGNGNDATDASTSPVPTTFTPHPNVGNVYENDSGLVSYWKLANNANDSVGSNNLTNNGATFVSDASAVGGYHADFIASESDYLSITDAAQSGLDNLSNFSFYARARRTGGAAESYHPWLNKLQSSETTSYYTIGFGTSVIRVAFHNGTAEQLLNSNSSYSGSTWYYVAATYDGSTLTAFLDGLNDGSTSASGSTGNNTADVRIGGDQAGTPNYYDGEIDYVAAFNRALTPTEVHNIYNNNILPSPLSVSVSSSVTVADSPSASVTAAPAYALSASSSITIADSPSAALGSFAPQSISVSDAVTVADDPEVNVLEAGAIGVQVDESIMIAETLTVPPLLLPLSVTDAITIADSPTIDNARMIASSDGITISESTTVTQLANVFIPDVPGIGLQGTAIGDLVIMVSGASNTAYGTVDLSGNGTAGYLNIIIYFDFQTLTLNDIIDFVSVLNNSAVEFLRFEARYADGYQVRVMVLDSDEATMVESGETWQPVQDGEHYIQAVLTKASELPGADGQSTWYLDGTQIGDKTDASAFAFNWNEFRYGITGTDGSTTDGNYYLDEVFITYALLGDPAPSPPAPSISGDTGLAKMLRIVQGIDPANPTASIDISGSSGGYYLDRSTGGPSPGELQPVFSDPSARRSGEQFISETRRNAEFDLNVNFNATNMTELGRLFNELMEIFNQGRRYELEKQGEPIWVEYRWDDGLNVDAPVWGQYNHYMRIRRANIAQFPNEFYRTLVGQEIDRVVARFICDPLPQGVPRWVGRTAGQWAVNDFGLIRNSNDNLIANPTFANPSTWSTGWTSDSGLLSFQSSHSGFYKSYNSAAWLVNPTGSVKNFYMTYAPGLSIQTYYVGCLARTPDGSAVSSSIMTMYGDGASRTTTYTDIGDGWYLCYASFTGASPTNTDNGVQVAAGESVIIDNVILTGNSSTPPHLLHGDLPGAYWGGTRHNSETAIVNANDAIDYIMDREMSGIFTIAGWVTPHFGTPAANLADQTIINYTSGSDVFSITLDAINEQIDLAKTVNGTNYTNSFNISSWSLDTPVHIAVVQTATQMILYVNGAALGSPLAAPGFLATGGTLALNGSHMAYDGWRVWRQLFSAAEVLQLYTVENTTKATRGRYVGLPTAAVFYNSSFKVYNYISSSSQSTVNYFYMIGVNGSTDADVEWRIETTDSVPGTYQYPTDIILARRALIEPVDPEALGWSDLSGTANANDVNGQHQVTNVSAGSTIYQTVTSFHPEHVRGVGAIVGRYGHDAGDAVVETSPMFHLGASGQDSYQVGGANTNQVGLFFRYFGPLPFIDYAFEDDTPQDIALGLKIYNGDSITREVQTDYFQLIPAPFVHIKSGESSTDILINSSRTVVVENYNVVLMEGTARRQVLYNQTGYNLTVAPEKYNQIFLCAFDVSGVNDAARSFVIKAKVTPKYELPGGPIA